MECINATHLHRKSGGTWGTRPEGEAGAQEADFFLANVLVNQYIDFVMARKQATEAMPFSFRIDAHSGVPVYRQLIDQVQAAVAMGALRAGDQLPTIRLVAVELSINPNTVTRAYREMEIRGLVDSQQGTGTFIADRQIESSRKEQSRQLAQLLAEFVSRAGSVGFTVADLIEGLQQFGSESQQKR